MKIIIGYLYPDLMNIYGDTGNIIALQKRAEWRGIDVVIKHITIRDTLKTGDIDIFFFGGGQDQQQEIVAMDLEKSGKGKIIKAEVERGVPLLSICGGYQLLGEYYRPHKGPKLPGVGVFPVYTHASHKRMIGNIVIKLSAISLQTTGKKAEVSSPKAESKLVGFENHSGQTFLKEEATQFGEVIKGFGNNGEDGTEGCIYKNAIGCYMHGSLLPKNPKVADWLIKTALEVKYDSTQVAGEAGKEVELTPLDDTLENTAHDQMINRLT